MQNNLNNEINDYSFWDDGLEEEEIELALEWSRILIELEELGFVEDVD